MYFPHRSYLLLFLSTRVSIAQLAWASEPTPAFIGVERSTSAIEAVSSVRGDVSAQNPTTAQDVHCERARLSILNNLAKGDICQAAAYLNAARYRSLCPADRLLINDVLDAFDASSTTVVMRCPSLYAALLKTTARNAASTFGLVALGKQMMDRDDFVRAENLFSWLLKSYPTDKYAPWALFYTAECDFNLKHYKRAARAYRSYYESFPDEAMAKRAREQEFHCRRLVRHRNQGRARVAGD